MRARISDPPEATDGLARLPEAQDFLALSRSAIYALMDKGELPFVKIGKCRRVQWSELRALVARNRVGNPN